MQTLHYIARKDYHYHKGEQSIASYMWPDLVCACVHMCVCACEYMYCILMYVCMRIYHIYIHIYIYTYIYTYTYTVCIRIFLSPLKFQICIPFAVVLIRIFSKWTKLDMQTMRTCFLKSNHIIYLVMQQISVHFIP